jgi:hypothetical protein
MLPALHQLEERINRVCAPKLIHARDLSHLSAWFACAKVKSGGGPGWRSRLRERPEYRLGARGLPKKVKDSEKPSSGFIDLGSLGSSRSRFEVRLKLGGGGTLTWRGGPDLGFPEPREPLGNGP